MIVEYNQTIGKYHLLILFTTRGYRLAYLGMDKKEWQEKFDKDSGYFYSLSVHGGVTFGTDEIDAPRQFGKKDLAYIGFDCNHIGDSPDIESALEYGIIDELPERISFSGATAKTFLYVHNELEHLVKELRNIDQSVYNYFLEKDDLDTMKKIIYRENINSISNEDLLFLKLNNIKL